MARYNQINRYVTSEMVTHSRARALRKGGDPWSMLDDDIDLEWAKLQADTAAPKAYYDYYFAGQDMRVYVAETADDPTFGQLPIMALGFNMEQEKTPVYGFASYTYDAVMRGNRVITGTFVIASTYPDYMKRLLAQAAKNRQNQTTNLQDPYPTRGLTDDDKNIERYWNRHIDASSALQGNSEWSVHPPFSLVLIYGLQNTSVVEEKITGPYKGYNGDDMLFADHNQRLIEQQEPGRPTRIVLDACELKSVTRNYDPSGNVLAEVYQFFARDLIVPSPYYSQKKPGYVPGVQEH